MSLVNFRYNWPSDNLIDPLTPTVVAGSADLTYGVANLVNGNPALPFKATGTAITLQWDLGSSIALAWIELTHGNITGTISITTNAASDFSGAGEAYPLTPTAKDQDGYYDDIVAILVSATPRRYVRLVVTGNASPVIIGELWISATVRSLTHDPAKGVQRPERRLAVQNTTPAGVAMYYDLGVREEGTRTMVVTTTRVVGETAVRAWYRAAAGPAKPFVLLDSLTGRGQYVRWDLSSATRSDVTSSKRALHELVPTTKGRDWVTFTLGFVQVSRGLAWP